MPAELAARTLEPSRRRRAVHSVEPRELVQPELVGDVQPQERTILAVELRDGAPQRERERVAGLGAQEAVLEIRRGGQRILHHGIVVERSGARGITARVLERAGDGDGQPALERRAPGITEQRRRVAIGGDEQLHAQPLRDVVDVGVGAAATSRALEHRPHHLGLERGLREPIAVARGEREP